MLMPLKQVWDVPVGNVSKVIQAACLLCRILPIPFFDLAIGEYFNEFRLGEI